jgi:hypothetical protein
MKAQFLKPSESLDQVALIAIEEGVAEAEEALVIEASQAVELRLVSGSRDLLYLPSPTRLKGLPLQAAVRAFQRSVHIIVRAVT